MDELLTSIIMLLLVLYNLWLCLCPTSQVSLAWPGMNMKPTSLRSRWHNTTDTTCRNSCILLHIHENPYKISDRAELYGCATFWAALGNTTHSQPWNITLHELKQKLRKRGHKKHFNFCQSYQIQLWQIKCQCSSSASVPISV